MQDLVMHVTANGDLAQAVLNAVGMLLTSETFKTAIKISMGFAILGTGISYIAGRDITVFAKWFIINFLVTIIMLHPLPGDKNLRIIDDSNPMASNLTLGNIPYGLAIPAHFITTFSHGLTEVFEDAFHMPDEFQYNKTGMLFGSRLFRLSTEINITTPELKAELNQYIKNCIIPDVNILKSYNLGDVSESKGLTSVIFDAANTSGTRGIYLYGRVETSDALGVKGPTYTAPAFHTCKVAAPLLAKYVDIEINKGSGFQTLARSLFPSKDHSAKDAAGKFLSGLTNAYTELNYPTLADAGLGLARQNLLINALRDGLKAYSAEANDAAGLLNLSSSQAMDRMRMNLATSRNMASYTIPVIHTALLLMMLGLFPVIILLALQPSMFSKIIKNYFYTLIWIESWPLMFACLNLITTFYIKSRTGAIGGEGLTMSNIDLLALEHSDIANMAGYLMILIPFISGGLVYGMSSVFTSAASYIGGVMQSSATGAATEAATGNLHLGNASWGNVNANKLDTNYSVRGGMYSEQTSSGLTMKTTADGNAVADSSEIQSRLPVHFKGSEMISAALSEQAEKAENAGMQDQQSIDRSISSAMTNSKVLNNLMDEHKNLGHDHATKAVLSQGENINNMLSVAESVASREGITKEDALRRMSEAYADASLNLSAGVKAGGWFSATASGNVGAKGSTSSDARTGHTQGKDINITGEEARKFAENYDKVKSFDIGKHAGDGESKVAQLISGISADLRNVETFSKQHNIHVSQAQSYRESATTVKQNSSQVDSDYNQILVRHVLQAEGKENAQRIFAGQDYESIRKLEGYAKELSHNLDVLNKYSGWSDGVNPKAYYERQAQQTSGMDYETKLNRKYNKTDAYLQKLGDDRGIPTEKQFDKKHDDIIKEVESGQQSIGQKIDTDKTGIKKDHRAFDTKVKQEHAEGVKKAHTPVSDDVFQHRKELKRGMKEWTTKQSDHLMNNLFNQNKEGDNDK